MTVMSFNGIDIVIVVAIIGYCYLMEVLKDE